MTELRGSATLTASSEYNGSYVKGNAVDGNNATEWASLGDGAASWIQFTWGSPVTIREIRLLSRTSDPWGNPRFTFADATYSDGSVHLAANEDRTYVMIHPVTTTSLRVGVAAQSIATGANTGFREVYISDSYTTTPTTDVTKPDHLVASSVYTNDYGNYGKWFVIDGNTSTQWVTNGDGAAAYMTWEYLTAVYVQSIQLRDRSTGIERWGTPRFTFSDASTQDGGGDVDNAGFTTYTLATPKTTTSLKVSIASGGSGANRGLAEAVITGNVTPPAVSTARSFGVIIG